MASSINDCQMEEDNSGIEIRVIGGSKGEGLFATKDFREGDVIFEEDPIVFSQYAWNATCGYKACDYCLRSLETVEENVQRLLKKEMMIPHSECCITDKTNHCLCEFCGVQYCTLQCKESAWSQYHETLCLRTSERDGNHPLEQLNEAWKHTHYPPETTSIMLFARILTTVNQAKDKSAMLHQLSKFCHRTVNEDEEIVHKLLGDKFIQHIDMLREMLAQIFGSPHVQHWLTPEGFRSLIAMVGTNGQGVGSSPIAEWAKKMGKLEVSEDEKRQLDEIVGKVYDEVEEVTDGFVNCEGSGLYSLQSKCNHSCCPNAEINYLNANFRLSLLAIRPICAGEEICISYLSPCDLERSRHSRHKTLRENYLFVCGCLKCSAQSDEPDETSDEELSSDEEVEQD